MKRNYVCIKNSDGKEWILPSDNLKIGLNIYQASSKKGLLLKKYLPVLMTIPVANNVVKKVIGISDTSLNIPDSIIEQIKVVFAIENPTLAYFAGTPSKHKKGTIQVSTQNKLLGYVKITENQEIANIFYKEQRYLDWLKECGVKNIPTCLFCGKVKDSYIFIQDTIKTQKSVMVHMLGTTQVDFIQRLHACTKTKCMYTESDYYETLSRLKQKKDFVFGYDVSCKNFERGLALIEGSLQEKCEFSAYHGDFTPWNSFQENEELYVFDFEYAKKTYPPYLDVFHYFTQSCIFELRFNAEQIFNEFVSDKYQVIFQRLFDDPEVSYLEYLYSIIAFYIDRDGKSLKADDIRNMKIWMRLIDLLIDFHSN